MIAATRDGCMPVFPNCSLANILVSGYRAKARPIASKIGNRKELIAYRIADMINAMRNFTAVCCCI